LDGLRGVAAVLVMVFHMPFFFGGGVPEAWLAVDFFFVLSGVVIANAYQGRLEQGLPVLGFLRIRLARFYPLYFIGLLLGVGVAVIGAASTPGTILGWLAFALFMLPSPFFADRLYPLNVQAWSLGYEILVNLLYAHWRKSLEGYRLVCIVALAGLALTALAMLGKDGLAAGPYWGWDQAVVGMARVLYSFGFGLLIHRMDKAWIPKVNPWILLILLAIFLSAKPLAAFRNYFCLASVLLFFPLVTLLGLVNEPSDGYSARIFSFLGNASYGIYILHYPIVYLVDAALKKMNITASVWSEMATVTGVILLAGWLDRIYDRPARRWLTNTHGENAS
jgi:peptidoglycan/LPS O-acetylase OafA/YrhL